MKKYLKTLGIILLVLYFSIANYCKFKAGMGINTNNCGCELK